MLSSQYRGVADSRQAAGGVWVEGYLALSFLLAKVEVPVSWRGTGQLAFSPNCSLLIFLSCTAAPTFSQAKLSVFKVK